MEYSCGTAAVRGNKELADGQHFWEIKMTSPVYGTDMMVGIGTSDVNLDKYRHTFCSLLGKDEDSWGLSYTDPLELVREPPGRLDCRLSAETRFKVASRFQSVLDSSHVTDSTPQKTKTSPLLLTVACRFGICDELGALWGTVERQHIGQRAPRDASASLL
ncbi:F-box/SPRY domain-containing protein 1-like [Aptenodytes patagonicus]|uniref:F-box/SPRY domain-containing protein 1-like n=1 Tax=Aptenodytes patagonicus TaxID=9234 RepID=UPI003FA0E111